MSLRRSVEVIQKEIEERFAELAEQDAHALTGGEVEDAAVRAQRIRVLADAQGARFAGLIESTGAWVGHGCRSATAWLAWRCSMARSRASQSLMAARDLRDMPATADAFAVGQITPDHVRLLATARDTNAEAFTQGGEALLLDTAGRVVLFSQFERAVRYWCQLAAPDDAEERARKRYESRGLHASRSLEGMVFLDGALDPVGGEIVLRELERIALGLFEDDLAEARERLGPDAPLASLRRTAAQRRADALRLMAERSAAKTPGAVEPRVLIHVLAGHDSVVRMCELSNGTVVTPGEVLPILDRAEVERAIFDGPSKIIDIGTRQRLYTGAIRTAVQLRDRQCVHPSCDVPAERCEIDHLQPWALGGPTTQDNGACRCKYHHRRDPTRPRGP